MIDKDLILALYHSATHNSHDAYAPAAHLSSEADARYHGKSMQQRIIDFEVDSVLDLGCGTGNPLKYIDPVILYDFTYHGVDLNKQFIKICRERWSAFRNFTFAQYDIQAMSIKRNYDAIFINETFSYFNLEEIAEMLNYYYAITNKVLSATFLIHPELYPHFLLIEQPDHSDILQFIKTNFKRVSISHDERFKFARVDIIKSVDLTKGGLS